MVYSYILFSQDEFKNIIGDISFLKRKKNLTNLFSTLKTQINTDMIKLFELIIEDENLSELFGEKTVLNIEETEYECNTFILLCSIFNYYIITFRKYVVDNDSMELIELEESLRKLDIKIAELEETNEVLFNQGKFNQQRYNQLSDRITKLLNECQTKYINDVEQTEAQREEFISVMKN